MPYGTFVLFKNFGGRTDVNPVFKSKPYPSQHTSQITLKGPETEPWGTHYKNLFYSKDTQPVSKHITIIQL